MQTIYGWFNKDAEAELMKINHSIHKYVHDDGGCFFVTEWILVLNLCDRIDFSIGIFQYFTTESEHI